MIELEEAVIHSWPIALPSELILGRIHGRRVELPNTEHGQSDHKAQCLAPEVITQHCVCVLFPDLRRQLLNVFLHECRCLLTTWSFGQDHQHDPKVEADGCHLQKLEVCENQILCVGLAFPDISSPC